MTSSERAQLRARGVEQTTFARGGSPSGAAAGARTGAAAEKLAGGTQEGKDTAGKSDARLYVAVKSTCAPQPPRARSRRPPSARRRVHAGARAAAARAARAALALASRTGS